MEDSINKRNSGKKKKKKKNKGKITALVIGLIFLFLLTVGGTYTYLQLNKIKSSKISKTNEDLGIKQEVEDKLKDDNDVVNIALFGLDRREKNEPARSDSVMVLSIDKKNKKLKLSSVMRDTYVSIKGHGEDKLTHAYAFGGPQLAIRTLNENFNLNIRNYVAIDFYNMEELIDALGGVSIDIKKGEINAVNGMMNELAAAGHYDPPYIKQSGVQTLNGKQALAYTRTRYIGNGDFERTERQRTVLMALYNKVQQAGPSKYSYYISQLLPFVETSLSKTEMITISASVATNGIKTLEQERFPIDGYCKGVTIKGIWYLQADLKSTADQIYKFIYEDKKPVPKDPLF